MIKPSLPVYSFLQFRIVKNIFNFASLKASLQFIL